MIESYYYKQDLLKFAADFEKRKNKQIWRENSLAKAEKHFFVGMLFVRKLLESKNITDACKRTSFEILRGAINPKQDINDFMRHDVHDYINEANWKKEKVETSQICDKVIHSWVNYPTSNDNGGLDGFSLTTDKYRNKEIWHVPIKTIIDIYFRFGNDYPKSVKIKKSDNGKIIFSERT